MPENVNGFDSWKYLSMYTRITLVFILKKYDVREWTGVIHRGSHVNTEMNLMVS
jgi:hypothetical protein